MLTKAAIHPSCLVIDTVGCGQQGGLPARVVWVGARMLTHTGRHTHSAMTRSACSTRVARSWAVPL